MSELRRKMIRVNSAKEDLPSISRKRLMMGLITKTSNVRNINRTVKTIPPEASAPVSAKFGSKAMNQTYAKAASKGLAVMREAKIGFMLVLMNRGRITLR